MTAVTSRIRGRFCPLLVEGGGEGVQGCFPAHGPACAAASDWVKRAGDQVHDRQEVSASRGAGPSSWVRKIRRTVDSPSR